MDTPTGCAPGWMQVVEQCREQAVEYARNRLVKAGIQTKPSFRRRPESSGFNKPFPQSGNDNTGGAH